jgi:hypothetical protein
MDVDSIEPGSDFIDALQLTEIIAMVWNCAEATRYGL